jgi:hypothetical protein
MGDPRHELPRRDEHDNIQRCLLTIYCKAVTVDIHIPAQVCIILVGPLAEECFVALVTRIPQGLACDTCLPSCLDCCLAPPGVVVQSTIHWTDLVADHALSHYRIEVPFTSLSHKKTRWVC